MHWAAVVPACTCTWRNYWYTYYILHTLPRHCACVCTCGEQFSSVQPPPWSCPAVSCPFPSVQSGGQQCRHPSQPTDHHWQPVGSGKAVAHPNMNMGTCMPPPPRGTGTDMQEIQVQPLFFIYLYPLPFFAAFSKSVETNTMKVTLAHSYMYQ